MALLHSFEFGPAIDSFNKVLGIDPNCAIAYWGIALSTLEQPVRGHQDRAAARTWPRGRAEGTGDRNADAARARVSHRRQSALRKRGDHLSQ